jgi:hypothetical protein
VTLAINDRNPGPAPAPARYRCHLVVPAFNEEDRIVRCLEAVLASPLPGRCSWSEWVILDGASTDATVERALATARRIPEMPALRIVTAPQRQGKAADLGAWHRRLLAEGAGTADLVVIIDADAAPEHHSIAAILRPLLDDEGLGVVWGTDRPDDTSIGRWASTFQMRLVDGLWRARGAETPRAYGRFLAYRPAAISGFSWQSHANLDDVQLAEWVERERVPVRSAGGATVLVTPAGSQHDFLKQTVRYWTAVPDAATALGRTDRSGGLPVAARLAAAHPLRAGAYLVARLRAQRTQRHDRAELTHVWSPPASTKGPVDRPGRTVKQEPSARPGATPTLRSRQTGGVEDPAS